MDRSLVLSGIHGLSPGSNSDCRHNTLADDDCSGVVRRDADSSMVFAAGALHHRDCCDGEHRPAAPQFVSFFGDLDVATLDPGHWFGDANTEKRTTARDRNYPRIRAQAE